MSFLLAEFGPWLIGIGATLIGIAVAYIRGRGDGKKLERSKQTEAQLESVRNRRKSDDQVSSLDNESVRDSLDRWMRNDG